MQPAFFTFWCLTSLLARLHFVKPILTATRATRFRQAVTLFFMFSQRSQQKVVVFLALRI